MIYKIFPIQSKEDLSRCPVFAVNHFLWACRRRPESFGRMGYLAGQGLYVQMTCMESAPKRDCKNHRDLVCKDSAMEVFLAFPDKKLRQTAPPEATSLYFNFEINANGAMYAKYGYGRRDRQFITGEDYDMTGAKAVIEPDRWSVELLIPQRMLKRVGGIADLTAGSVFFCNFYKISEDPAIEHYAAFNPIQSETPNFHLPQYFAQAVITEWAQA